MTTPAAKAAALAKSGLRNRLDPSDVKPGCIAWMPWASVIKVTHKDFHKGVSDGVEVIWSSHAAHSKGNNNLQCRPNRRAWNHPCVIVRCEGSEEVLVVGVTTFKGKNLNEKVEKYSKQARERLVASIMPIEPQERKHPLAASGNGLYEALKVKNGKGKVGGFVRLDTIYRMDWRDLQRLHGGTRVLEEETLLKAWTDWAKLKGLDMEADAVKKQSKEALPTSSTPPSTTGLRNGLDGLKKLKRGNAQKQRMKAKTPASNVYNRRKDKGTSRNGADSRRTVAGVEKKDRARRREIKKARTARLVIKHSNFDR